MICPKPKIYLFTLAAANSSLWGQIAKIRYDSEEGLIWRRDLKPTITVRAELKNGVTGNDATRQITKNRKYTRRVAARLQNRHRRFSGKKQAIHRYLLKPVPIMVPIIMALLMLQLQKISLMMFSHYNCAFWHNRYPC